MHRYNYVGILKFDLVHDALGRFAQSEELGGLRIRHASRFASVEEAHIISRTDLGHFLGRVPREMPSVDAVKEDATWMESEEELKNSLTKPELDTVKKYTGATLYRKLNTDLVKGKTSDKEIAEHATNLHNAILKSSIPEDVTLYRGMTGRGLFTEGKEAVGKIYSDKVFKSTSLVQDNALGFAAGKKEPAMMRIKAKKGQKGLFADGLLSENPHEMECILHPNQKFIITGHSIIEVQMGKAKTKVRVYDAEML